MSSGHIAREAKRALAGLVLGAGASLLGVIVVATCSAVRGIAAVVELGLLPFGGRRPR